MFIPTYGLQLAPAQAKAAWVPNPVCAAAKAGRQGCYIQRDKRWVPTQNRWIFGWDPKANHWVATNGRDNARVFRTKRDLVRYAERMRQWNWLPVPVA